MLPCYFELLRNKDQLRNAYDDYQRRLETINTLKSAEKPANKASWRSTRPGPRNTRPRTVTLLPRPSTRNNLDRFKLSLGLPLTTKIQLDDTPLQDLRKAGMAPLQLDRDQLLKIAIEHQLELLNAIDRFEDSKRKVKVAANQLKADLNIFATASLNSEEPTDYTEFDLDNARDGAGIELDLPIDRLQERNDVPERSWYLSSRLSAASAWPWTKEGPDRPWNAQPREPAPHLYHPGITP